MRDCPSINVLVRVAHITPVNKVVRRLVLMAREQLDSSLASTFPALLLINNACNFKVLSIVFYLQIMKTRRLQHSTTAHK
jgi:hypothetical protein